MVKQLYLTHRQDLNRYNHFRLEWTWEQQQWRSTPYSPELKPHHQSLSHIQDIQWQSGWGESCPSAEMQLVYSTATANWAAYTWDEMTKSINTKGITLAGRLHNNRYIFVFHTSRVFLALSWFILCSSHLRTISCSQSLYLNIW